MRFLRYHLPVILCAAGIFIVSSIIPPREILDIIPFFPHSDKVFHALAYCLLAFLVVRDFFVAKPGRQGIFLKIAAFTAVFSYGIIIEVYQYFLPARTMELMDILSNGIGALAGILFFSTFCRE
jgi:VanZ family protein